MYATLTTPPPSPTHPSLHYTLEMLPIFLHCIRPRRPAKLHFTMQILHNRNELNLSGRTHTSTFACLVGDVACAMRCDAVEWRLAYSREHPSGTAKWQRMKFMQRILHITCNLHRLCNNVYSTKLIWMGGNGGVASYILHIVSEWVGVQFSHEMAWSNSFP